MAQLLLIPRKSNQENVQKMGSWMKNFPTTVSGTGLAIKKKEKRKEIRGVIEKVHAEETLLSGFMLFTINPYN